MHHTQEKIILKNLSKLRLVVSPALVTLEWLSPVIWWQEASGSPVHLVPSYTGSWWGDCIFMFQLYLITVGAASAITGIKLDCPYFPVYYGATLDIVLIFFLLFYFPSSYFVLCFYLADSQRLLSRWTWLGPVKFWVIVYVTLWCQVIAYFVTSISYNRN